MSKPDTYLFGTITRLIVPCLCKLGLSRRGYVSTTLRITVWPGESAVAAPRKRRCAHELGCPTHQDPHIFVGYAQNERQLSKDEITPDPPAESWDREVETFQPSTAVSAISVARLLALRPIVPIASAALASAARPEKCVRDPADHDGDVA